MKRANTTQFTCAVFFSFQWPFRVDPKAILSNIFGHWLSMLTGNISMTKTVKNQNYQLRPIWFMTRVRKQPCVKLSTNCFWRLLKAFRWQNSQELNLSINAVFDKVSQNISSKPVYSKIQYWFLIHEFFLHPIFR